ncbi:hypothetical protein NHX12_003211 [Muraenolepis orangiensis]|uniref:Uncharacterized protein n=1 Tax=Muraenolepis orangiensis TaxID=630683 RepID=A0A9Q0DYC3_9TELE|nr:hypothetical protein NHX12_003211 [Muraenolepis orangiensis]
MDSSPTSGWIRVVLSRGGVTGGFQQRLASRDVGVQLASQPWFLASSAFYPTTQVFSSSRTAAEGHGNVNNQPGVEVEDCSRQRTVHTIYGQMSYMDGLASKEDGLASREDGLASREDGLASREDRLASTQLKTCQISLVLLYPG